MTEQCKETNKNLKEIGKNIDLLTIKVNSMEQKINELDDSLEKTSISHFALEAQFKNLVEETAQQRFQLNKLTDDNTRIKEIQEKVKKIEILEFKVNSIFETIQEMKEARKEDIEHRKQELEYREKRAKERKQEKEQREKDRVNNIKWIIGLSITILGLTGTFIWTSLSSGIQIYADKKIKSDTQLIESIRKEFGIFKSHQDTTNWMLLKEIKENTVEIKLLKNKGAK